MATEYTARGTVDDHLHCQVTVLSAYYQNNNYAKPILQDAIRTYGSNLGVANPESLFSKNNNLTEDLAEILHLISTKANMGGSPASYTSLGSVKIKDNDKLLSIDNDGELSTKNPGNIELAFKIAGQDGTFGTVSFNSITGQVQYNGGGDSTGIIIPVATDSNYGVTRFQDLPKASQDDPDTPGLVKWSELGSTITVPPDDKIIQYSDGVLSSKNTSPTTLAFGIEGETSLFDSVTFDQIEGTREYGNGGNFVQIPKASSEYQSKKGVVSYEDIISWAGSASDEDDNHAFCGIGTDSEIKTFLPNTKCGYNNTDTKYNSVQQAADGKHYFYIIGKDNDYYLQNQVAELGDKPTNPSHIVEVPEDGFIRIESDSLTKDYEYGSVCVMYQKSNENWDTLYSRDLGRSVSSAVDIIPVCKGLKLYMYSSTDGKNQWLPTTFQARFITKGKSTGNTETNTDIDSIFDLIYPIGSIYITVENDIPPYLKDHGTWVQLATGRTLWNVDADSPQLGGKISAGLPNISGSFNGVCSSTSAKGAFYQTGSTKGAEAGNDNNGIGFEASRSNGIYGSSDTVQPPAIGVTMWKRIDPTNQIRVIFKDYDGYQIDETYINIGSAISENYFPENNPSHTGFTFSEWSIKPGTQLFEDTTITAIYKYNVTLKVTNTSYGKLYLNDDTSAITSGNQKTLYTNQQNIVKVVPTPDGAENPTSTSTTGYYYKFNGWTSNNDVEIIPVDGDETTIIIPPVPGEIYTANIDRKNQLKLTIDAFAQINYNVSTGDNRSGTHWFTPKEDGVYVTVEISGKNTTGSYYRANGWNLGTTYQAKGDNEVTYDGNKATIKLVNSNQQIRPLAVITQRLVTFNYNSGDDDIDNEKTITMLIDNNTKVTPPDQETMVREGYSFVGWYANTTLTTTFDFEKTNIGSDKTFYAKWVPTES